MQTSIRYITALVACGISMSAQAAVLVTDPGGLNADINPLNRTISASYGNVSLADVNNNFLNGVRGIRKYVFSGEPGDGFVVDTNYRNNSILLTEGGSGIDMELTFRSTANFIQLTTDANTAFYTSGEHTWMIPASEGNPTTTTLEFGSGVDMVAFTINRLVDNATIRVWADTATTQQIGTEYILVPNLNPNHSFFGFERQSAPPIRAVTFDFDGGGGQLGLDDISFGMYIPEPSTAVLFLLGPLLLKLFSRRFFE